MGGGASVDLRTSELADLAEEKEYGRAAQIVREQKINPRTALKLQEDEIDELAKDDKIARRELHTALEEFKEAAGKRYEVRGGAPEAKAEAAPPTAMPSRGRARASATSRAGGTRRCCPRSKRTGGRAFA